MNDTNTQKVITRFAPSPTGFLHIGRVRTALFNYLFARHHGGEMVLRIEDTDKERSKKEYEEDILESLKWLGIDYDKGPFRQSERTTLYREKLKQLIEEDKAYVSKEEVKKEGDRAEVIRFRNPNKTVTFTDLIRGEVSFDTTELGDFIIARSMEEPLYHLTVVVDDHEMGITHVIRGDDGISNTPRQILIQEALGMPRPIYAHMAMILAPDKSKLSGRHGAVSVRDYKEKGYLPETLVNYLAFLGWNPGTEKEVYTIDELIADFDITKVQKGGALFSKEKLNWFNKEHLKLLPKDQVEKALHEAIEKAVPNVKKEIIKKVIPVVLERIEVYSDIDAMAEAGELDYFFEEQTYDAEKLIWKKSDKENTVKHLNVVIEKLSQLSDTEDDPETIKAAIWEYAEKEGRGDVLWPLRYALSGRDKSPDPFVLVSIISVPETLERLKKAQANLASL